MPVSLLRSCDEGSWDLYARSHAGAHVYHLAAWRRIIESSFRHRASYLVSRKADGRIDGILPLVRLRSRLFGDFVVSLPYVNDGGPCADNEDVARTLVDEAVRLAAEERVRHLEVRMARPADFGLRSRSTKVAMRVGLANDPQVLWASFPSKLRSQINRAQREAATVRFGREEQLDAFYRVFAINMRDLGTPVYGREFFAAILRELPDSSVICTVYLGSEPVAAGLLIGFGGTLEIPWASSLRRYNRFGPNMLLYWSASKFGCERGYATFDFGRSTPGSGPHKFKAQWGAAPVPLTWHYWVAGRAGLPQLTPQNPRYQLAVRVWRHLPVVVTRAIGPSIVRNLP